MRPLDSLAPADDATDYPDAAEATREFAEGPPTVEIPYETGLDLIKADPCRVLKRRKGD